MSHWPESWKSPDLRSQPRNISTGCKRQPRSNMCSMARDPRRADPDPVAAVVAAVVSTLENPATQQEMEGNLHHLLKSARDVENLDTRKVNQSKQWK